MLKSIRIILLWGVLSCISFWGCSPERPLLQDTPPVFQAAAHEISWAENSVFYQVFVRSFYDGSGDGIGDFKGLAEKLPYFEELGVNALWLLPISRAESYHGYDVIDYYSIEPDYGTMEDFLNFLEKAQENSLKVIIDFVVNHTSTSHPWFIEASKDPDNPYYDYYIWTTDPDNSGLDSENFRPLLGTDRYYYAHYSYHMPDLNYHNPRVREEIKEMARYWLDLGVNGFRLDGSNVIDPDREFTIEWWHEFNTFVKSVNPSAFVVGENWYHIPEDIAEYYQALESSFNFALAEEIYKMSLGARINILQKIQQIHETYSFYAADNPLSLAIDSTMVNNHDMDRIATRLDGNEDRIKLAASLLLTLPGTPFIYYGDELGQRGQSPDPNRREPFPWYKELEGPGMTSMEHRFHEPPRYLEPSDGISLEEQRGKRSSIFEHYRHLIKIRQENPDLFTSENYHYYPVLPGCYSYYVAGKDALYGLLVIHNLSSENKTLLPEKAPVYELMDEQFYRIDEELALKPLQTVILSYSGQLPPFTKIQDYQPPRYQVHFQVEVPDNTPKDSDIYMTGNFNQWNPADSHYLLQSENGEYSISLEFPQNYLIQFKFTRGCWDTREQNIEGADLIGPEQRENRTYIFHSNEEAISLEIEKWADR